MRYIIVIVWLPWKFIIASGFALVLRAIIAIISLAPYYNYYQGLIDSFGEEGMQLENIIMQHARRCAKNSNSILGND